MCQTAPLSDPLDLQSTDTVPLTIALVMISNPCTLSVSAIQSVTCLFQFYESADCSPIQVDLTFK